MEEFLTLATPFIKNHTLLVVAWVAIFIAFVYVNFKAFTSKVKLVSNAEAVALMNNQNAVVIDLRTIEEFKRGHIVNSQEFVPSDIKNHNLGKLEQHKDVPVILVCASGVTARASGEILAKQGFKHVYALQEGIAGWNAENLPLVK
ncbi:rhodanese-like domain-containing protein [Bisgaard Taxon 10/6]|uniref:Rhodanese-like domain-containing protein n=1 Tax=Exercitatus varius TaxID=67857 RepID=A0AAW6QD37_9PAST|nr:rhodanese-like domain-containing protein [Exercitatus varius]MDG2914834.1 rhodanese-like domain-containing protein [Exercitatus varius]MDG2916978.1 rhodanese-like domain-containing protein [Exercitatus varius]MDG2942174.1 rhodanese-like domain-containing protein [Exercitatus varius]MDG2948300.1 rhodanese-like domain-containing protein [Exercitatus varius]MDG2950068.1 rhodanese-like domain-containing protein [Exercitatus varius]